MSRWLDERGLAAGGLSSEAIESFLVDRRQQYRKRRSGRALGPLLGYLRSVGAVPEPTRRAAGGEVALLVDRYRRYLVLERGLSVVSVRRYLLTVGRFLDTPVVGQHACWRTVAEAGDGRRIDRGIIVAHGSGSQVDPIAIF